jgi:hypothetical protein
VKIAANRAAFALHMPRDHFLYFHFVIGEMYISLMRQLAPTHPVRQFLHRHFAGHLFANAQSHSGPEFTNPTSAHISREEWKLAQRRAGGVFGYLNLPAELKRRGVDDAKLLPNFLYRDEGLVMWEVYWAYITEMVALSYKSDADVVADYELQNWVKEMASPLTCNISGLPVDAHGVLASKADLVLLLTSIVNAVTSHHSFSTTAGADFYAYVPNQPKTFKLEIPKDKKASVTLQQIKDALPSRREAINQMAEIYSIESYDYAPLLKFDDHYMRGLEGASAVVKGFEARLHEVEAAMKHRVEQRGGRFNYLLPSLTAASVWN